MTDEIPTEVLAETQEYIVWRSQEPDEEVVYHIELGSVTLHFFREEWQEMLELMEQAAKASDDK